MLLDCVILALHTACKTSLSSYQMMGLRNSRVFKFGQAVLETWDLFTDSKWEATASPSTAEANLPAWRPTWPPLQPEQSAEQHRESHIPCQSHCSRLAFLPSLSSLLTLTCSGMGITKLANAYCIWTNCTAINILFTHACSMLTHMFIKTFTSVVLVLKGIQIFQIPKCSNFLL